MTFTPRLTKPEAGNKYYITKAKGGWSTAIVGNPTDPDCNVLHNCVGYAFGRFNEILGDTKMTHLLPVNAENFYSVAISQGLKVGAEPALGAVIVWEGIGSAAGHVAVVEEVHDDGSILTSESGYKCANAFWTTRRTKGNGNWGAGNGYKFLGFIYLPGDTPTPPPTPTPTRTIKKGMHGDDVKEMQSKLADRGYLRKNEIDGAFGKITLGGLLAFQFENGLEVDGLCGPATKKALGM
jgi:hypothetical protein